MKHTFKISGMTCGSCKARVEDTLKTVEGVIQVSVNLENAEAEIEMRNHIALETFKTALSDKYTISEVEKNIFSQGETTVKAESELKQLKPLFLIIGYITIASLLLHKSAFSISAFMLDFMGLFYIVFSFFKLLDLKGFPESFRMYDPLAKLIPVYGWIYPFIETALGLMFLMRFQIDIALYATIFILGITTIGVTRILLDKKSITCACLGTALKLPMTKATFIENTIMLFMAIWMLVS